MRRINAQGVALVKKWEGCKLRAYRDIAGVLTIGFGHTGPDVCEGLVWSMAKAEAVLLDDLREAERSVLALVRAPISDNMFSALVSFTFNLGAERLRSSTLLRMVNAGEFRSAAAQFDRWIFAGGVAVDGLKARRAAERELFLSPF